MILGHATSTYLGLVLFKKDRERPVLAGCLIGAYLPDLIDKPLMLLFHLNGRGMAHTLLMGCLYAVILGSIWRFLHDKKIKSFFLALLIGNFLHLLQDLTSLELLLWPLMGAIPAKDPMGIFETIKKYYQFKIHTPTVLLDIFFDFCFILLMVFRAVQKLRPKSRKY